MIGGGTMAGDAAVGGNRGLIAFGDRPGAGDALRALALLLTTLSAGDRPLSAVVDDGLHELRPTSGARSA